MPEIIGGYETIDGDSYLKKRNKNGKVYHVRKGDGQISADAYNGGLSRFQTAKTGEDGKVLPDLRDAMSIDSLREKTGIPFDRNRIPAMIPDDVPETTRNRLNEYKRFQGFFQRKKRTGEYDDGEKLEAAKEYLEFRAKLEDAEKTAIRQQIRQQYMKAGY
jgi:hypothetical protein